MKSSIQAFEQAMEMLLDDGSIADLTVFEAKARQAYRKAFSMDDRPYDFWGLYFPYSEKFDSRRVKGAPGHETDNGSPVEIRHGFLPHALHMALWPVLLGGGDSATTMEMAEGFKAEWLRLGRHYKEAEFKKLVTLWVGWAAGFDDIVGMIERMNEPPREDAVFDHAGTRRQISREDIHNLLMLWLMDAMLAEVPELDADYSVRGRPRKDWRRYLISQVFDDLAVLLKAYPKDTEQITGLRKIEREQGAGSGLVRKDFGLFSGFDDLGCRDQCVELLIFLMPSMEQGVSKKRKRSERTWTDMFEAEQRKLTAEDPWLSEAERAALAEPLEEQPATTVKCASPNCGRVETFPGRRKAAYKAARDAGWRTDMPKTCPACLEKKKKQA